MIGEFDAGELLLPECFLSMPTAILAFYTSEGFAVGADRRAVDSGTGNYSDNFQKIFKIQTREGAVACAFAGDIFIGPNDSREIVFDSPASTTRQAATFVKLQFPDLRSYAECLSKAVSEDMKAAVSQANSQGRTTEFHEEKSLHSGFLIAHLFALGYIAGSPGAAMVSFWHRGQIVQNPLVENHLSKGYPPNLGYGPKKIRELIYEKHDAEFTEFLGTIPENPDTLTLQDAVAHCRNFVLACQTDRAREIDQDCKGVGGCPVIATVTPPGKFNWAPGFEPPERHGQGFL